MTDVTSDPRHRPLGEILSPKTAEPFVKAFGIHTVGDLLEHLPRRYLRRGELTDLRDLRPGEHATVSVDVTGLNSRYLQHRRLNLLEVSARSGQEEMRLSFFSRRKLTWKLEVGKPAMFSGKVEVFRDKLQMTNPEVDTEGLGEDFADTLVPIYPATAKLESKNIGKAIGVALDMVGPLPDPLPPALRKTYGLMGIDDAYRQVHRPVDAAQAKAARERLKWDEALVLQVALAQRRLAAERAPAVPRSPREDGLLSAFDDSLPFTLTAGQLRVGPQISADLVRSFPMQRLLQGEVGSGKTVVALRAMLTVVDSGGQAALLAPTEVLATQHLRSLRRLLGDLAEAGTLGAAAAATNVVLLTGSQPMAARRKALLAAADGSAGIVVGTHALLTENVQFADLGLVVVDEQHRFGVEQRDLLRERAEAAGRNPPHLLVMTATPIPRTVAMTVFGDLETSTLTELPAGRTPIRSHVAPTRLQYRMWERVREEVAAGHQAFVVCPRIGEKASEDDEPGYRVDEDGAAKRPPLAVVDVVPRLEAGPLAGLSLDMLHGRLT
ncbi:MAG: ATP-dependent helicase RecG, partial [Frankiaceae bacterium]|nr:ATP-dependent helicase RecG [Frankiaceae bacterium]